MSSFNQVVLLGNLSRDPELRYTPKGAAVAQLGLAINRKWKTETGEQKEEVSFIDCTAFSKTAETIGQYCKKGHLILLHGRLKQETWDDKQTGQKRSKVVVIVEGFQFMPNKDGGGDGGGQPSGNRTQAPSKHAAHNQNVRNQANDTDSQADAPPPGEDDVPF